MTPKERRHAKTRQAILDTARKIINSNGQEGLSMRAIARAIDYSPAGLYEYFGSKEEIIEAVCEQGSQYLYRAMAQVDATLPIRDYLRQLGHAYLDFANQYPDYFMLMFTAANLKFPADSTAVSGENIAHSELEDSAFSILVAAIARGVEEGAFVLQPEQTVLDLAFVAWVQVHGLAMLWLNQMRHMGVALEHLANHTLDTFTRGISG